MQPLKDNGLLTATPFDEPIDFTYFELWHHWGRTAKFGAWMQGPDYTQWHGAYEMLSDLEELQEMVNEKLVAGGIVSEEELGPESRVVNQGTAEAVRRSRRRMARLPRSRPVKRRKMRRAAPRRACPPSRRGGNCRSRGLAMYHLATLAPPCSASGCRSRAISSCC